MNKTAGSYMTLQGLLSGIYMHNISSKKLQKPTFRLWRETMKTPHDLFATQAIRYFVGVLRCN